MRYPAAEKLEIIRLVERSRLPVRRTLARIGVPPATFYRWYERYREHGPKGLEDRSPGPVGCGTASPSRSGSRFWRWRSKRRSCRPGSWRCASPTGEVFRVRGFGLSPAQGARPDYQPGLRPGESGRRVHGADDGAEPALADRLHLPQGDGLGLVLPLDDPRRLFPLHRRLEALHHHARRGRDRHAGTRPRGFGLRHPRKSSTGRGSSATTARPMSPAISHGGSRARASPTSMARRTIPRPRARSSAGTRL